MLHRRYFLSVIIIITTSINNIVATDFFLGRNSGMAQVLRTASHVTAFGNMIYRNGYIIAGTAMGTALITSYDNPKVMCRILGISGAYLFYRCIRLEKNMDHLTSVHEEAAQVAANNVGEIKKETASLMSYVREYKEDFNKVIPEVENRIDPLASQVITLKGAIEKTASDVENQNERIRLLTEELALMRSRLEGIATEQSRLDGLVTTEAQKTRQHNTQNAERILASIRDRNTIPSSFNSGFMMGGIAKASFNQNYNFRNSSNSIGSGE